MSFLTIRVSIVEEKIKARGGALWQWRLGIRHAQAGYMTANLNRYVRQIILAFSGASIHDNTGKEASQPIDKSAVCVVSSEFLSPVT